MIEVFHTLKIYELRDIFERNDLTTGGYNSRELDSFYRTIDEKRLNPLKLTQQEYDHLDDPDEKDVKKYNIVVMNGKRKREEEEEEEEEKEKEVVKKMRPVRKKRKLFYQPMIDVTYEVRDYTWENTVEVVDVYNFLLEYFVEFKPEIMKSMLNRDLAGDDNEKIDELIKFMVGSGRVDQQKKIVLKNLRFNMNLSVSEIIACPKRDRNNNLFNGLMILFQENIQNRVREIVTDYAIDFFKPSLQTKVDQSEISIDDYVPLYNNNFSVDGYGFSNEILRRFCFDSTQTKSEIKKPDSSTERIMIKFSVQTTTDENAQNRIFHLNTKGSFRFKTLFKAVLENLNDRSNCNFEPNSFNFYYNDILINGEQTPSEIGISKGEIIHARLLDFIL